ncbi:growth hormone-inducible transmembrane protein-like [Clavelina lepadiformis]|uniref:Growth hormone-inducible transmembrane protein n=1 Tax=Clavelina lepadiformis TaxID=159417 RepID=A0ABP0G5H7_CLALP
MLVKIVPITQLCMRGMGSKVAPMTAGKYFLQVPKNNSLTGRICQSQISTSGQTSARASRVRSRTASGTVSSAGITSIGVGRAAVAGASLLGIGGLCYYGMGLSSEIGAIDKAMVWPQYVKDRVRDTYMYFGGSLIATAGSAVAIARNPTLMRIVSTNGMLAMVATIGAMIGTSIICRSVEYKPGFGKKQLAWLAHTAVIGAVVAPLTVLGGPLLVRAAWYTAGIVGGLSTIAMCAPSDKFLNMGGPLAAGLGVVFVSSIGTAFIPPTGALGMGLYSIAVYGGLILFGGFLLYDTQRIVRSAESTPHPMYAVKPYDPVNASMSIYMDTINIFIRIAMIMAGNRKK